MLRLEVVHYFVFHSLFCLQGLTSSGYLLAVGDDNQMCELHPDGNR